MFSVCVLAANNILSDTLGQNSKSGTKASTKYRPMFTIAENYLNQQTLFFLFNQVVVLAITIFAFQTKVRVLILSDNDSICKMR